MKVGDTAIRIHHRQLRASAVTGCYVCLDRSTLCIGQGLNLAIDVADAIIGIYAQLGENHPVFTKHFFVENRHGVAEDNRIGDLHHGRFEVQRQEHTLFPGIINLHRQKLAQRIFTHDRGIYHFTRQQGNILLEHCHLAIGVGVIDAHVGSTGKRGGLFTAEEIPATHMGDMGFAGGGPGSHRMRMFAGVSLDRSGCPAIRVAFPQYRVDRTALDTVITVFDILLLCIFRRCRIVWKRVALTL